MGLFDSVAQSPLPSAPRLVGYGERSKRVPNMAGSTLPQSYTAAIRSKPSAGRRESASTNRCF
jgi:hypothetical protein